VFSVALHGTRPNSPKIPLTFQIVVLITTLLSLYIVSATLVWLDSQRNSKDSSLCRLVYSPMFAYKAVQSVGPKPG
jgi:hypothetical protein